MMAGRLAFEIAGREPVLVPLSPDEVRAVECGLCGRVVGVSYRLTGDVVAAKVARQKGAARVAGEWAFPVRHLQELASGRLSRRYCATSETGKRAP